MTDRIMPLGVFTSAGAGLGAAIEKVVQIGAPTVQLHAPGPDGRTPERADEIAGRFADAGVEISLVFCGFPGDRYDTIPVVRQTVGLVPPETRQERIQQTKEIADFAAWLEAPGIGIHIGFVPEDWDSAEFGAIAKVVGEIADHCAGLGLTMNLETGQETADTLLHLLETVDRENLAVNFDPANMILYGSGEPLDALRKVGDYVRSVHCKDATWSDNPGEEWGVEVPLGEGDVNIREFVKTLRDIGYTGPLTIEREVSGERQITDIKAGLRLLREIKQDLDIG
ncbi:MAG: sugar phosphate isomerase/epimerase family protein [Candidatus Brocadiia bacterium]